MWPHRSRGPPIQPNLRTLAYWWLLGLEEADLSLGWASAPFCLTLSVKTQSAGPWHVHVCARGLGGRDVEGSCGGCGVSCVHCTAQWDQSIGGLWLGSVCCFHIVMPCGPTPALLLVEVGFFFKFFKIDFRER